MTGPRTAFAIAWTDSKSPGEEAGNPASMMSTLSASSCRAISTFCSLASFAPGNLLPVPQRRVEDEYLFRHLFLLFFRPRKMKAPGERCPRGPAIKTKTAGTCRSRGPMFAYAFPYSLRRRSGSYGSEVG